MQMAKPIPAKEHDHANVSRLTFRTKLHLHKNQVS